MVSENVSKKRFDFMESYNLLELTGSESENDIIHFAPFEQNNSSQSNSQPRKKRLKRKERDMLRSSGAIQYENPSKLFSCGLCCLPDNSNILCHEALSARPSNLDKWDLVRTCLLIVTIICLCLFSGLVLHLHSRLDATQETINKVEASGSELPAKFHESHVRLQQLEKNHTALWLSLNTVSNEVKDITQKVSSIESSLKALEDRLSGAPQLSALPKDVADIQNSVAKFGSSLQDVQSALKALKEGQDAMHLRVNGAGDEIKGVKGDIMQLKNFTHLPAHGREGSSTREGLPVVDAILALRGDVTGLTSSVTLLNESLTSSMAGNEHQDNKVQSLQSELGASIGNLSDQVNLLESFYTKVEKENLGSRVANISLDLATVKRICSDQGTQIQNLNQSIAVVKGVERKLEGSQVQMASGVSDVKQQLQKLQEKLENITPPSTTPSSGQTSDVRTRERREVMEYAGNGVEENYFFKIRRKKPRP